MLDQAASSGSNFLLVFLLARGSTPHVLGILLLAYGFLTLIVALNRSAFGALIGMDHFEASEDGRRELVQRSVAAVLGTALAPLVALLAWSAVLGPGSSAGGPMVVLAVASPFVLVQDLLRHVAIAAGHPVHALLSDGAWLLVCVLGLGLTVVATTLSLPTIGAAIWGAGAVFALITLLFTTGVSRPRWRGTLNWVTDDVRRKHLATDSLLAGSAPLVNASLAGALVGAYVIGAVRGAGTLFGPLNTLSASVALAVVPEAKRVSRAKAEKLFNAVTLAMLVSAVAWGSILTLLPERWGTALLGETWGLAHPLLVAVTVEYCGLAIWTASTARMRANNQTRLALKFRTVHASLISVLPAVAAAFYQSALAFSVSLAVIALGVGLVSDLASRRAGREVHEASA